MSRISSLLFGPGTPWRARMAGAFVLLIGLAWCSLWVLSAVLEDVWLSTAADKLLHFLELFVGALMGMLAESKMVSKEPLPTGDEEAGKLRKLVLELQEELEEYKKKEDKESGE